MIIVPARCRPGTKHGWMDGCIERTLIYHNHPYLHTYYLHNPSPDSRAVHDIIKPHHRHLLFTVLCPRAGRLWVVRIIDHSVSWPDVKGD